MKKFKRMIAALLTCLLSFFMINTVSATSEGSITISGTTEEKTYEIYKIFDLTYSKTNVAYTIDSNWTTFFTGTGSSYIVDSNVDEEGNSLGLNPITVTNSDGTTQTKYINITENNKMAFSEAALSYITTTKLTADATDTAEEGETSITFSNLDLGYYLVYPKGATDIKSEWQTICTLTSTMPSVTVQVKATYPGIEKKASDESVDVGELVKFTITGKVPTTTGYNKYIYIISDTWTGGLELPNTDDFAFTVKLGDTTITNVTPITIDTGFSLEFDMTQYQDYKGQTITVSYYLRVTEEAITATTQNSATLEYSNNPKDYTDTEITPPEEIPLYSSQIIVDKYETGNISTKLSGAQFVLTKVVEGTTYYYRALDTNENLITSDNENEVYVYTTTGVVKVEWTQVKDDATILTTNENGVVEFKGIENGIYALIETKAPEGYNLLSKPHSVTVEPSEDTTTKSVSLTTQVANNTGTELPTTGGFGTKLFIIIGSLLAIISSIILVTTKRISKEF